MKAALSLRSKVVISRTEISKTIIKIIGDHFNIFHEKISENTDLRDLEFDSLDAIEVLLAIENVFQIEISEEAEDDFKTVYDVVEFVFQNVAEEFSL